MYTLKIKWESFVNGEVFDETTLFIPAAEVRVHGEIINAETEMSQWSQQDYDDYRISMKTEHDDSATTEYMKSRIVQTIDGEDSRWFLCSKAWLMGADGKTIEKLI